ncbi:hypothetical protein PUN28_008229 [Cardiocondyla obscurior]|uniref:Uncharacterized protein n=1 Tax=Cardiocondyla obscurior TaxID=286306 RepID=A0AAW2FZU1_9HYME
MSNGKVRCGGLKYQIRKIAAYYHTLNRHLRGNRGTIISLLQQYRLTPITVVLRKPSLEDIPKDNLRRQAYENHPQENAASCDADFVEKQRRLIRDAQSRCQE